VRNPSRLHFTSYSFCLLPPLSLLLSRFNKARQLFLPPPCFCNFANFSFRPFFSPLVTPCYHGSARIFSLQFFEVPFAFPGFFSTLVEKGPSRSFLPAQHQPCETIDFSHPGTFSPIFFSSPVLPPPLPQRNRNEPSAAPFLYPFYVLFFDSMPPTIGET